MTATVVVSKKQIPKTPPLPEDLPKSELTENARQVLLRRYVRHTDDGQPAETVEEMFWRVAYHIAHVELAYDGDVTTRAREFYYLLNSRKFFPNSPTFTGAGTPLGQLAACFVLPITDDMGRDPAGIFQSLTGCSTYPTDWGGQWLFVLPSATKRCICQIVSGTGNWSGGFSASLRPCIW